jgi:uncharacterized damage-inducible protein DinB
MSEAERIADQLRRSHRGPAWHGPSVLELVQGITASRAAAHTHANSHSIWDIVLHLVSWQSIGADALAGRPVPPWPFPEDWPKPDRQDDDGWRATIQELQSANDELVKATRRLTDERRGETVPGRDYSVYFLLHGIAQHNLYHAGQIALLKKL